MSALARAERNLRRAEAAHASSGGGRTLTLLVSLRRSQYEAALVGLVLGERWFPLAVLVVAAELAVLGWAVAGWVS